MIITAPQELRERLRDLSDTQLLRLCAGLRPNLSLVGEPEQAAKVALRALGHRHAALSEEIAELEALIAPLVEQSPLSAGADVLFSADPLVPLGSIPDGVTRGGPVDV